MQIWINGSFHDRADARISVFDAGLQHGVGLFETLSARNGRIFRAVQHMERLADSAEELALTNRLHIEPLVAALQQTLERNELQDARLRLTLTGGDLGASGPVGQGQTDPTIIIAAQAPTEYPESFFERGVAVTIAAGRLSLWTPTAGHKTVDYWTRIQALQVAAAQQAGEALWLTPAAKVASGSVSNIFIIRDDVLITPVAHGEEAQDGERAPVLPGITRAAIMEAAGRSGIEVQRRDISLDDLAGADEAFLTNASWGVLPVSTLLAQARDEEGTLVLDPRPIGGGAVGTITADLRTAWLEMVALETTVPN